MPEAMATLERPDAGLFACLYQPPLPVGPAGRAASGAAGTPMASEGSSPLVAIAAEFSPRYEQHRTDLVSVDVRGLSRLLGTPRAIGAEMRREAAARGLRVHVAIAPSRMAALVLALARPGLTVVMAGGVAEALAPIPLTLLEHLHEDPLPAASKSEARVRADEAKAATAALKRWGLRTLGELAALPGPDLSARLGRGGRRWQAIARGEDTRPLVPMQPEERFEGRLELEWPIEGAEPLSFVLTRLLEPLSTRLERRDRGAAVLHVELGLVTREVHACRLELPSPLRDVRALRTLALLDFEARPPAGAIDTVTVTIEPTPGRILQHALFARPHPTPEQLSTLLARLGALMGQDRVGAPAVVDSYRPGAFAMTPFAIDLSTSNRPASALPAHERYGEAGSASAHTRFGEAGSPTSNLQPPTSESNQATSALRRCRQPIPARVVADAQLRPLRVTTDRRGFAGGTVLSSAGPWRTSGAWWEETGSSEVRTEKVDVNVQKPELTSLQPPPSNLEVREFFTRDGDLVTVPSHTPRSPKPDARSQQPGADAAQSQEPEARRQPSRERHRRDGGPWSRDEWDVALADGAVYRIFRDRVTDGWFIDGVVD
ncbi:MAG: hypothetical protein U0Q55_05955 [Vicinamibacterales bacterium]